MLGRSYKVLGLTATLLHNIGKQQQNNKKMAITAAAVHQNANSANLETTVLDQVCSRFKFQL